MFFAVFLPLRFRQMRKRADDEAANVPTVTAQTSSPRQDETVQNGCESIVHSLSELVNSPSITTASCDTMPLTFIATSPDYEDINLVVTLDNSYNTSLPGIRSDYENLDQMHLPTAHYQELLPESNV